MMATAQTGVIILAGGGSSRLQQPKQLLVYQGQTLLRHAAETALHLNCGPVVVVTGALHEELIITCKGLPVTLAHNEQWREGMSTSITKGLQVLQAMQPDQTTSVLLMLSDQPLVNDAHLQKLLSVFRDDEGTHIVATGYAAVTGVPAVFSKALFTELYALKGDKGAKALFTKYQDRLKTIAFEGAAVDIDTPDDIERLEKF